MAKSPLSITGLDIEQSAVYAAGVVVNGTISVRNAAMTPLEPGVIRDGEVQDVDALTDALRQLFADHRDLEKRVRIGVANQKIVVRVISLPPISDPKQLGQAVRFQAQDEIPMPLDAVVLDFQPLDIVDTASGPRQRVAVVAARRDMIDRVLLAVRGAGLKPEGVDLAAFGMVRALYRPGGADERVAYIAVGGLTNFAVAHGTICEFTRVIGTGLDEAVNELAERRAIPADRARAWLEHTGLSSPVELVANYHENAELIEDARAILVDTVRRVGREVRNSIDFASTNAGEAPVSRCVVTGSGAALAGFAEQLAAEVGYPVEVGAVDAPAGIDGERLSVAAGLAVEEVAA